MIPLSESQGQVLPSPPAGVNYQVSYTMEEVSFYQAPEGIATTTLSPLDQIKLMPRRRLEDVERRIATNGGISAIITILNPEEAYAEWPQKVGRFEIDGAGVRVYKTDGTLYKTLPADAAEVAGYQTLKSYFINHDPAINTTFPMPSAGDLIDLQAAGATVFTLPDNALRIRLGNQETLLEPSLLQVTHTRLEGQTVVEKRTQKYAYNLQGIVVPAFERTEKNIVRPSGACLQKVVQRRFSRYLVSAHPGGTRSPAMLFSEKSTVIWPNPATADVLNIRLDDTVQPAARVTISNAIGQVMASFGANPGETLSLPLTNWPEGVYFVNVPRNGAPATLKFVKQNR